MIEIIWPSAVALMILYWLYKPHWDEKATRKKMLRDEDAKLPRISKRQKVL